MTVLIQHENRTKQIAPTASVVVIVAVAVVDVAVTVVDSCRWLMLLYASLAVATPHLVGGGCLGIGRYHPAPEREWLGRPRSNAAYLELDLARCWGSGQPWATRSCALVSLHLPC